MSKEPQETDVLVPFEIGNFPTEYREYYGTKRHNLFAMIQKHREMWNYFHMIDQIIFREIDDLQISKDPNTHLPRAFFINAHAKIRIAIELAFQGCMQECRSILRDAVEWTAYGHYMLGDPTLPKIWLEKDDDSAQKMFKEKFDKDKKNNLFKGLPGLYQKHGELSEGGSHPTPSSLYSRIVLYETPTEHGMSVYYSGVRDEAAWAKELFSRLLTCFVIEDTFYNDFQARLKLDFKLMDMRREFSDHKEQLRQFLIKKYNINAPVAYPTKNRAAAPVGNSPAGDTS